MNEKNEKQQKHYFSFVCEAMQNSQGKWNAA